MKDRVLDTRFSSLVTLQYAERTGLEPATSYVTGRRSNQLNYHSRTALISNEGCR